MYLKACIECKAVFHWKTSGAIFSTSLADLVTHKPQFLCYPVPFPFVLPPSAQMPLSLSASDRAGAVVEGSVWGQRLRAAWVIWDIGSRLSASFKCPGHQWDFVVLWCQGQKN